MENNLKAAFPELSRRQRARLTRDFYQHFCNVAMEALRGTRMEPDAIYAHIEFSNWEILNPLLDQRQSILFLTSHQGNWGSP